jgi:hypothetical protein
MKMWKDIPGYEGIYQASTLGEISTHSYGKTRLRILSADKRGYFHLALSKNGKMKNYFVHRIVALTFLPNDDPLNKTQVNHIDGNKSNNSTSNLEWCSRTENKEHAVRNGLVAWGERNRNNVLTQEQVSEIRHLLKEGFTYNKLAEMFGVQQPCIYKIATNRIWKRLEGACK